jgi:hypothetical protein
VLVDVPRAICAVFHCRYIILDVVSGSPEVCVFRANVHLWYNDAPSRSVVFLESLHPLAYNIDISHIHLPMTTSRALVKNSAALIRTTCLNITELQLGILALGTGLGSHSPGISILGGQDLHI